MSDHPPPFRLEAWHAGEPDADAAAHVATCEACKQYVAQLAVEREAFVARESPEAVVRALRARAEPRRPTRRWWWYAIPAVALPVFLAVLLVRPRQADIRLKGSLRVAVVVLREGAQSRHEGRVEVQPGDRLRVQVTLPEARTLTVGVLEGDGTWIPIAGGVALASGEHDLLPSFKVDERPLTARIVAGSPEAVRTATTSGRFEGVATAEVVTVER